MYCLLYTNHIIMIPQIVSSRTEVHDAWVGDDANPYSETVDLVEELVIQFITEMTMKAMEVGKSGRVHVNDVIFIIRKDRKKYSRVKDLLMMKEQIDKAKKAFSEDSEVVI